MGIVVKGILAGIWLILIPGSAGQIFLWKKKDAALAEGLLSGYLLMFSLMEILVFPLIYFKAPLHILVGIYGILLVAAAAAGLAVTWKKHSGKRKTEHSEKRKSGFFWFIAAWIFIVIQIGIVAVTAHFDADDAMYVGAASASVQTDTIYSVNPYTGFAYKILPSRYILSPFPVFLAVISRLCLGLHPGILAHVIFAAVFLFLAYLVQYLFSKEWFPGDRSAQGIFLAVVAVLNWFSAYSLYNSGMFQMIRIWQGKALLASAMLPFVFYLCLTIFIEKEQKNSWILLGMANLSCCLLSSMGIMLAPLMIGLLALTGLFLRKKFSLVYKAVLCCLPSLILGIVYILIK